MKKHSMVFTVIGLVLGIIFGIYLPRIVNSISFIGTIYINLLKFMIVPIIFTSIVSTIYKSKALNSKFLLKTVFLFIIMFVITFCMTSLIVNMIKPGANVDFEPVNWDGTIQELSVTDVLVNLFPSNMVDMIQKNSIFAIIIFAVAFAMGMLKTQKGEKVAELVDGIKDVLYKILEWIMYLTPLATFSLVGNTIANYGSVMIGIGLKYIGIAYLCSILALVLVMILPAWIFGKVNPIYYIRKMAPVWLMTMTTCSSAATLPTTIKTCNEEFHIPHKVTDIVVPLGCTIHMCGGAVSFALLGFFCLQLFSIPITITLLIQMLLSATIINMAAPGIPNGGIVIGATYLSLLGIPIEFIGLYSGIYKLLDMAYTTLNVTGDVTANVILDKEYKE